MSMNIMITASRKITFKKKDGKRSGSIQTVEFSTYQTPTHITKQIIASDDPAQTYIDYILAEVSIDQEEPVYADDDIYGEGKPVGVEIYNGGKEHVEEFKAWIAQVEEDGFTVKFKMI